MTSRDLGPRGAVLETDPGLSHELLGATLDASGSLRTLVELD